jgi:hypothetical protein
MTKPIPKQRPKRKSERAFCIAGVHEDGDHSMVVELGRVADCSLAPGAYPVYDDIFEVTEGMGGRSWRACMPGSCGPNNPSPCAPGRCRNG